MKSEILALVIVVLCAQFANAQASSKVAFNSQISVITGQAPQGSKVTALFMFTPDSKSLAQKKCNFADDDMNMNGKDHALQSVGKVANGQYELNFSMTASKGQCQYVLTQIYFTLESAKVYETITLVPQGLAPKDSEEVAPVKDASPTYCEFSNPELGLCEIEKNNMIYTFNYNDQKIMIDFKDLSQKPPVVDSDVQ